MRPPKNATQTSIGASTAPSAGRVRGWHLELRLGSLFTPRFLWECLNYPHHIPVSIPCHLERHHLALQSPLMVSNVVVVFPKV